MFSIFDLIINSILNLTSSEILRKKLKPALCDFFNFLVPFTSVQKNKKLTINFGFNNISIIIDIINIDKTMGPKCCNDKKSLDEISQVTDFLKIISEENRLKILCLLKKNEMCVCNIWQFLDIPQNLTSHHLKVLKDFGLVEDRREGLRIYYSINRKNIKKYTLLLNNFLQYL